MYARLSLLLALAGAYACRVTLAAWLDAPADERCSHVACDGADGCRYAPAAIGPETPAYVVAADGGLWWESLRGSGYYYWQSSSPDQTRPAYVTRPDTWRGAHGVSLRELRRREAGGPAYGGAFPDGPFTWQGYGDPERGQYPHDRLRVEHPSWQAPEGVGVG